MNSLQLELEYNRNIQKILYARNAIKNHWPKSITHVPEAFVVPQTTRDRTNRIVENHNQVEVYDGGVYASDGRVIESSIHFGPKYVRNIPYSQIPSIGDSPTRLRGNWLFGGIIFVDFGHFITESLGRLWALDEIKEPLAGIVFSRMNGIPAVVSQDVFSGQLIKAAAANTLEKRPFIREILKILEAPNEITIVGTPLVVENLIVPSQQMGLCDGDLIGGSPTYKNFLRGRMAKLTESPSVDKKIYVSRSRLDVRSSYFFLERVLEEHLRKEGYQIIHPEALDIKQQLKIFGSAKNVILATGSAAHMLALATTPQHRIALLHRHPDAWQGFGRQLGLMGAEKVVELDYTLGSFLPRQQVDQDRIKLHPARTIFSLDFRNLWMRLREEGFVMNDWIEVPEHVFEAEKQETLMKLENCYDGVLFDYVSTRVR